MSNEEISILFPKFDNVTYCDLSPTACHDLGLDYICKNLTQNDAEQKLIMTILSKMTKDPRVSVYRGEVFEDILRFPTMRDRMKELLDHVRFLQDFSSMKSNYDKKLGIWDLLHRLDEIHDYITCVEGIRDCLSGVEIHSEGLKNLLKYVQKIYDDSAFAEMKKDIASLRADTSNLKSVTIGINVNERFEAKSIGVISINNKPFKNSGIVSNFADAMMSKEGVKEGNEWDNEMHYHAIDKENAIPIDVGERLANYSMKMNNPIMGAVMDATLVKVPEQDGNEEVTHSMERVVNQMLSLTVRKLRDVLTKYVKLSILSITSLIPEFVYYIRFAENIEKLSAKGMQFCAARILTDSDSLMQARGIYNMKLAFAAMKEEMEIVPNDLDFDEDHMVYILTGANRGGKTTITQAVGHLYVLAQGGIYVPATSFAFIPVDAIFTHFPADEDKTMDLGRLGEECTRFKEIFKNCTEDSLILLNETFSTTSFEEGYYIARDSVRAILTKKVRTIYNTHMHKLAYEIDEMNTEMEGAKASSLIVEAERGQRSFKVVVAPPVGMSFASDIAEKYGVTFEMLTK